MRGRHLAERHQDLYYGCGWEPTDARAADYAAAYLWSEHAYLSASLEVLQMFHQLIDIGYGTALQDVRGVVSTPR